MFTEPDFYPFQIWCCNTELYERGHKMGLEKEFMISAAAVKHYEESCKTYRGKVTFEFRHYYSPDSYKVL